MNARYSRTAMGLHWLMAVLVIGLIGWGLWMSDLPKGPERGWAIGIHKSFGMLALMLVFVRLGWRLGHRPPPNRMLTAIETRLANAAHHLLYVLLVVVPGMGLTSVNFTKYPLKFFAIEVPKAGWPDEALNTLFSTTHKFLAWTLIALIVLHVAAAIRHTIRRDGTMQRMLPGKH